MWSAVEPFFIELSSSLSLKGFVKYIGIRLLQTAYGEQP